jgi:diketogulonate reductase-like aldo/keto reductase
VSCAERSCRLVAIAYLLHKTPYVFPIVGGRKVEHLKQNIQALDITLSPEQIRRIDDAKPFDFGFPYTLIVRYPITLTCGSLTEYVNRAIIQ